MTHQNNIQFSHNFCESRLNNNEGPEYFNGIFCYIYNIDTVLLWYPC